MFTEFHRFDKATAANSPYEMINFWASQEELELVQNMDEQINAHHFRR